MSNCNIYNWQYLGKGTIRTHQYYVRVPRPQIDNCDWALGLGMHNFRAAERKYSSKIRKTRRKRIVKKKSKRCVELVDSYRSQGFNPKFNGRRPPVSVNKAIKATLSVHDVTHSFQEWSELLMRIGVRRSSRYRRFLASQRRKDSTLCSEKRMAKLERKKKSCRFVRRREWFHEMSFGKLPTMVIAKLGNGFSKYCTLVLKVGCGFAFWLFRHWKTRELHNIRLQMEKVEKERIEAERIRLKMEDELPWIVPNSSQVPKPKRTNYPNFKKWAMAVNDWQISLNLCMKHYRVVFDNEFDVDKEMWKGVNRYTTLNYKACSVCGEKS